MIHLQLVGSLSFWRKFLVVATIDIIILSIFAVFAFFGFKHGMIKSLLFLLNSVVSWLFSAYLSKILSQFVYAKFVEPSIFEAFSSGKAVNAKAILDKIPEFLVKALPGFGITLGKITHIINSVSKEALPGEISRVLMPVITEILKSTFLGIIFVLVLLVGRMLIKLILKMFKLKALNYSDKIMGGILGIFKGYVAVLAILCVVKILIPFGVINDLQSYVDKALPGSVIFSKIYNNNPFYTVLKKV